MRISKKGRVTSRPRDVVGYIGLGSLALSWLVTTIVLYVDLHKRPAWLLDMVLVLLGITAICLPVAKLLEDRQMEGA